MDLYIIRHGDPDYAHDTLTEKGWEQAKALVPRIRQIQPTDIYASPRTRAQHTAQPSCDALGMTFSIEEWMNESMDYMQLCPPEKMADGIGYTTTVTQGAVLNGDFAPERTEAVAEMIRHSDEFLARQGYVREGFRYRAVEPNKKRICCFCHGGFGSAWMAHLLNIYPVFNWYQFCVMTTSVSLFHFHEDESGYAVPRAMYIGDCSHLWKP